MKLGWMTGAALVALLAAAPAWAQDEDVEVQDEPAVEGQLEPPVAAPTTATQTTDAQTTDAQTTAQTTATPTTDAPPRPTGPPAPPAVAPPEVQAEARVAAPRPRAAAAPEPLDPRDPALSGEVDLDHDWGPEPPPGELGTDRAIPRPFTGANGGGAKTGGIVLLTMAAVGAVTAGVLGGLALAEQSEIESGCGATGTCTDEDLSAMSSLALAADVAWPVAAGTGVVGLTLLVLGLTIEPDEAIDRELARDRQQAEVRVAPIVGPGTVGAVAVGRF